MTMVPSIDKYQIRTKFQNGYGEWKNGIFQKNNFKNRTLKKMKYLSNQDQNIVSVKLILFYPKINKWDLVVTR